MCFAGVHQSFRTDPEGVHCAHTRIATRTLYYIAHNCFVHELVASSLLHSCITLSEL